MDNLNDRLKKKRTLLCTYSPERSLNDREYLLKTKLLAFAPVNQKVA